MKNKHKSYYNHRDTKGRYRVRKPHEYPFTWREKLLFVVFALAMWIVPAHAAAATATEFTQRLEKVFDLALETTTFPDSTDPKLHYIEPKVYSYSATTSFPKHPTPDDVKAEIVRQFTEAGLKHEIDNALRIANCESNYRWYAKNPQPGMTASGVFQFIAGTWKWGVQKRGLDWTLDDRFDAQKNIDMTIWLLKTQGWHHWECK